MTARRNGMTNRPESAPAREVDVLSEVLRAVRLQGAVYYHVTASTPWVAEAPPARELAPHVMPGSGHVIEYHVVMKGSCWAGIIDGPSVRFEAGDIIIFPQGDAHVLGSEKGVRGPTNADFGDPSVPRQLPIRIDYGGSGRDPVEVVCGFLACDDRPFNPLLSALPRMLFVKKDVHRYAALLEQFMATAVAESTAPRPGGEVVLARLSELMFVEVVRSYIASNEGPQHGWLSGLRDEVVGRALSALHSRPTHAWTIDTLAQTVGTSRSALAARFMELVGQPPMHYLARWRMQLATAFLAGPSTLAETAEGVGYGSEAAFSRAFKKIVGVAPATWRALHCNPARVA